jgi:hypothetical protein
MDKPLSGWPSRVLDEYGRDLRDAVRSIAGASSELRSKAERALADALAAKDTAEAQVAVLVRALMPFAKFIVGVSAKDEAPAAYGVFHSNETPLTVRDFRLAQKAVAAYKASREGKEGE